MTMIDDNNKLLRNFQWAIILVLFIMFISALCIFKCIDSWDHRGQFGDLFGVVNALFSGLAFAGLIITIRQQHQDLEYQKQAIEQTNLEMKSQTKEFDKQNETLRIERFENTFFKMLEVQQSIVNDLYAADSHKEGVEEDNPNKFGSVSKEVLVQDEYRGRNLFFYVFTRCEHYIGNDPRYTTKVYGLYKVIEKYGMTHFDDYFTTTMFDHYFRHLYTILKYISQNEWLGEKLQYQYATFVRATLSRYELVMLYYNGFFHPKMKIMLERYSMLNNLRKDLLPMSCEYYTNLMQLGISVDDLKKANFSGGDFEYYLADTEDDDSKYYLGAFFTPDEMYDGQILLNSWRTFVNKTSK